MSKHSRNAGFAGYIAAGMVIGSAIGTAAAVMMTAKKKKPEGIREKAMNAMDTMGSVMQNIANMVR
ncbi:MAG: hypothetical protein E7647_07940 [Ruminococcaceae bacterium]|nr:hypothetical protein [Oscillospiraceae bacterium]